MKIKKQLKELVKKSVEESFDKVGRINKTSILKFTKAFQALPVSEAIPALNEYLTGLKRVTSQNTLTIEASIPLSKTDIQKIRHLLEKDHKISQVFFQKNPGLLGGTRIKIGDLVIDNSINRKIEQLGEAISA